MKYTSLKHLGLRVPSLSLTNSSLDTIFGKIPDEKRKSLILDNYKFKDGIYIMVHKDLSFDVKSVFIMIRDSFFIQTLNIFYKINI